MDQNNDVEMALQGDEADSGSQEDAQTGDSRSNERGLWANRLEFFLAITGYTVGLGSVWRFPIICSRNGGGAFLIPFFFFLITSGGPLYYLEVCLGQFTGMSAGLAFEFCPLLKGLGILQVLVSLTVLWYLMLILAYVLYFLYSSFRAELPWTTCNNEWNTHACKAITDLWSNTHTDVRQGNATLYNGSDPYHLNGQLLAVNNITHGERNFTMETPGLNTNATVFSSSAFEFWEYHVIGRSSGLEEMGHVQIHLLICFFLAWVFCVGSVIKGVKSLGKVVYVTATAPYVGLTIIFIKGLTLDGAIDGIKMYIDPDWSKLLTSQVWLEAAVQVFFSLGPAWGGVITMSSYNKFHDKTFWSSTMCVVSAGFTAFYNGLVVFTLLGHMAKASGVPLQEVASQSGPGLAFVVFPTVLSQMPLPQLWSVLFFLMLITVTFDSLFAMFETVTSACIDFFPHQLVRHRAAVNIIGALCFFIVEIPLTMNDFDIPRAGFGVVTVVLNYQWQPTFVSQVLGLSSQSQPKISMIQQTRPQGGIYLMQLADWYFSQWAVIICSFLELVAVCWIYGTDRFAHDISLMTGRDVCVILRVTWTLLIPLFLVIIFFTMISQYSTPQYGDGYVYSAEAVAMGIFIGLVPIFAMIVIGIVTYIKLDGPVLRRLRNGLRPSKYWLPHDKEAEKMYRNKTFRYPSTWCETILVNLRGSKDNPIF